MKEKIKYLMQEFPFGFLCGIICASVWGEIKNNDGGWWLTLPLCLLLIIIIWMKNYYWNDGKD